MEELFALRQAIEQKRYSDALLLLGEMEEMSKEDKIEKIYSFMLILLLHLIKQQAENRTTRAWELSIKESIKRIQRINQRRKAGGHYMSQAELREILEDAWDSALDSAALEAFEGRYDAGELAARVDKTMIQRKAWALILSAP
jgi:hypothetical protein